MTGREIRMLSHRRNALKGQLCSYRTALRFIDSRTLSTADHAKLVKCMQDIDSVLNNWDPHYIKNTYSNKD